jgi:predicted RecB family nuclease
MSFGRHGTDAEPLRGSVAMAAKITEQIIEAYVNCKTKAYLKLQGEQGTVTDYELLRSEMRERVRGEALKTIKAAYPEGEVLCEAQITVSVLKRGAEFVQGRIADLSLDLTINGLKKMPGACALGNFHYVPVWCYEGERIRQNQRQLVAILGVVLGELQERLPAIGLVYYARGCKATRLQLTDALKKKVRQILYDIRELYRSKEPPRLMLNSHCRMCEFRQRCRKQAMKNDDLSLLTGMGEKEIRKYNQKGIFTTTQLSCTFRLRKRGKRVKRLQRPHYFALQAAAIRDKKVYVLNPPSLPASPVQIYLDVEGDEERSFV